MKAYGGVIRVPGYRSRSPDTIPTVTRFSEMSGCLERGSLSLVSTIEEILERRSSGFGLEKRNYGRRRSDALTM
jgi:hypothetical protein